jgi:hypothetical protein
MFLTRDKGIVYGLAPNVKVFLIFRGNFNGFGMGSAIRAVLVQKAFADVRLRFVLCGFYEMPWGWIL